MRESDIGIVAAVVIAFGTLVTAHLCIVAGLVARRPRWHAAAALLIAPLAPYWAVRDRMYVRAAAWLVAAAVYTVARVLAT